MHLVSKLRRLLGSPSATANKPRPPRTTTRLAVENLESRVVPAFLAPVDLGAASGDVQIGDFNNDGLPDLVAGQGSAVAVRLGSGDGTFQPPRISSSGAVPTYLAVGDLDGDGRLDAVASDAAAAGKFSVLLGNGDGTFRSVQTVSLPQLSSAYTPKGPTTSGPIALGDVTGDGRLDLVIAGYRPPATGGPVSFGSSFVLLYAGSAKPANGSKTVSYQSATFHTVLKIGQLVAADFNRDGRADVLTTAQSTQTGFKVMLQLSGPGGSLPAPREVGFVIGGISVADFDNNGQLDFASSNRVYLGDGSGGFVLASNGPAGTSAKPVAAADVNADGKLDLVSANTVDAALTVLLGDGGGRLTAADTYLVGANISRLVAGDFDGDGYPDLVVLAGGQLLLLRNDGQW